MDVITIFQALLGWAIPALAGGAAALLALLSAYLIYRKAGKKTPSRRQIACAAVLCCWLVLVLGLTTLSRGANYDGWCNLNFLSGYISAWNNWSVSELQLILFNMLMFAPLGFFLPLLFQKAENIWVTLAVSFGLTAAIELFQLVTGTGIFELDDLFHNLIGSLFGYFCIMAIRTTARQKALRFAPVAKALLIPGLLCAVLGGVFLIYERQPYGNMSIVPAARQDLSAVNVVCGWQPSQKDAAAPVYQNRFACDKAYIDQVKTSFGQLEGLTFDRAARREDENLGYTGTDQNGAAFRMLFFVRTGEWSYTTFAENAAQLSGETAQKLRARYEAWMNELGLLPAQAVFSIQNGDTLRWDAGSAQEVPTGTDPFQMGAVMLQFDPSGALSSFQYQLTWNEYAATEKICSEAEAYAAVQQGRFSQYVPFQPGDTLHVNGCSLTYLYDTKGFYQPVYTFSGYINSRDNPWTCRIPARR